MSLLEQTCQKIEIPDPQIRRMVQQQLDRLTKPIGSLGTLEELALRLAEIQQSPLPTVEHRLTVVMAGDHGVCAHGISAYPPQVTAQMVANFLRGGAAVNVLARQMGSRVLVVNMGVASEIPGEVDAPNYLECSFGQGTRDFLEVNALTHEQAVGTLEIGIRVVEQAAAEGVDIIVGGDMGIGNTTTAAVITSLVTGQSVDAVVGRGTGASDEVLQRKRSAVGRALTLHRGWHDGVDLLERVGGFEIGGLAGLMLGAASRRIPFVLDGFIATAAALIAQAICPDVVHSLIAAHLSAEPGHAPALRKLQLQPLLQWNMRLGEGSGAVLVLPLLEAATRILSEMATFESAGVSGSIS